jgi:hypothetical protein
MSKTKAARWPIDKRSPKPCPVVHRVELDSGALPTPSLLAAALAPKLLRGDKIKFPQRFKFDVFDWLLELDAAFHAAGAYDWSEAVASALYLGDCRIERFYWEEHLEAPHRIAKTGELMVFVNADGTLAHWNGGASYFTLSGTGVDPNRWEPGVRYGVNYRPCTQQEADVEYISFRDARLGLQLADFARRDRRGRTAWPVPGGRRSRCGASLSMARKKKLPFPATREEMAVLTRAMANGTDRARLQAARILLALTWPAPGEDLRAREAWMAGEAWKDWEPWESLEEEEEDDADTADRLH